MRWRGGRRSGNVQYRGGGGLGRGLAGGGIGAVVLALVAMFFGVDPGVVLQGPAGGGSAPAGPGAAPEVDPERAEFVEVTLGYTEDVWHSVFQANGARYQEPTLVVFEGATQSSCGLGQAAMGPFYCPLDQTVYIDLSFYEELQRMAPTPTDGDFAEAYVIAHEVGHHVQTLLGISEEVQAARRRVGEAEANALSVRQELQADCFAGLWAHHAQRQQQILEGGDVEEALAAAAAIGDDRLQRQSQGYVVPESFTHGTSEQRARWFRRGLETGSMDSCNTFGAAQL